MIYLPWFIDVHGLFNKVTSFNGKKESLYLVQTKQM